VTPSATTVEAVSTEDPPEPERRRGGTGWVKEANGSVHRASETKCDVTIHQPACGGTESRFFCKTNADCKDGPHGQCSTGMGQIGTYCACEYACETDAECGNGEACVCMGTGALREDHSVCAKAECKFDADCGEGTCGLSAYHNGCSETVTLACTTKDDACKSDKDCQRGALNAACVYRKRGGEGKATWQCAGRSCVIGRPLIVDGEARAASPRARDDWRGEVVVDRSGLSPAAREALVAHYTAMAALEHASVASFARFSLELLALGAPSELVTEAHKAALDEVEHARTAFAIASRLAGQVIGPDKLPAATAPLGASVEAFVASLVMEGCVGETLGAAEGLDVARRVEDPALRAALERIAADEERHAALAWRTLKWALEVFGGEAREAAAAAFAAAAVVYAADPTEGPVNEAFGMLAAATLGEIRRDVLAQVVGPCRGALGLAA
jgi:hypothetical protein